MAAQHTWTRSPLKARLKTRKSMLGNNSKPLAGRPQACAGEPEGLGLLSVLRQAALELAAVTGLLGERVWSAPMRLPALLVCLGASVGSALSALLLSCS